MKRTEQENKKQKKREGKEKGRGGTGNEMKSRE